MKFRSSLMDGASGSLNGMTASRNRAGQYLRSRAIPVQPNSPSQQAVKANFAYLANYWISTLTPLQRTGWTAYGNAVAMTDALGQTHYLTGQQQFIRTNTVALQCGLAVKAEAPSINDIGEAPIGLSLAIVAEATTGTLTWTAGQDWAASTSARLVIQTAEPQNGTINFFKGPFRFDQALAGSATPITSATPDFELPVFAGSKGFCRVRVLRSDGRLSTPVIVDALGVEP